MFEIFFLPKEIVHQILFNLPVNEILTLSLVVPNLEEYYDSQHLWRLLVDRDFGLDKKPLKTEWNDFYEYLESEEPNKLLLKGAKKGNLKLVNYALSKDAHQYNLALILAAGSGNIKIVKLLIEQGATTFNASVAAAARHGHLDIVKLMFNPYSLSDEVGQTRATHFRRALADAAEGGHKHIMDYLISRLDLWEDKPDFEMTISQAAFGGQVEIMETILWSSEDIHKVFFESREEVKIDDLYVNVRILFHIFSSRNRKRVKEMIRLIVDYETEADPVILTNAARNGFTKIVKNQLELGCPIYCLGVAIKDAAENGHFDILKYLWDLYERKDDQVLKDIIYTAARGRNIEILEHFMGNEYEFSKVNEGVEWYNQVLIGTIRGYSNPIDEIQARWWDNFGNFEYCEYLLKRSIKKQDKSLGKDLIPNIKRILNWAIKHGANKYRKALEVAMEDGYLELIKFIIERGADILSRDDFNHSLFLAIEHNNLEAVKILIHNTTKSQIITAIQNYNQHIFKYLYDDYRFNKVTNFELGLGFNKEIREYLYKAVQFGNVFALKYIIASLDKSYRPDYEELLKEAIKSNNLNVVKYILSENCKFTVNLEEFINQAEIQRCWLIKKFLNQR